MKKTGSGLLKQKPDDRRFCDLKHLSRFDIEAIAAKYVKAYMELPDVRNTKIYRIDPEDRKSTRQNSSHSRRSRMPSSA